MSVLGQHLIDVKMHLLVFVFVQAADMALIETLEQRRQVLADGAVDQAPDIAPITRLEKIPTALQVIAHRSVDSRGE